MQNQAVEYLHEALKAYALGTRPSGIMQPVVAELDEAEMRVLAAHYAGQAAPAPAASGPASASPGSRLALGRRIAEEGLPERGVIACERGLTGRTLFGQPLVPALALGSTALALAAVALVALRALDGGWGTASRARKAKTSRASWSG